MPFNFKDFLEFESVLNEGGEGSGRPGDNDRPNKSLWFRNPTNWYNDMNRNYSGVGGALSFVSATGDDSSYGGAEEEEVLDDLYVINRDTQECYGCWRKDFKRGITFKKPRPFSIVKKRSEF